VGLIEDVERGRGRGDRVRLNQAGDLGSVNRVYSGENLSALASEKPSSLSVFRFAQDTASDRFPFDPLHDHEGGTERCRIVIVEEQDRFRDSDVHRRPQRGRLGGHPACTEARGVAAEDERELGPIRENGIERPRLPACPTGQTAQPGYAQPGIAALVPQQRL
jgi:hypothetical protein